MNEKELAQIDRTLQWAVRFHDQWAATRHNTGFPEKPISDGALAMFANLIDELQEMLKELETKKK